MQTPSLPLSPPRRPYGHDRDRTSRVPDAPPGMTSRRMLSTAVARDGIRPAARHE